MVLVHGICTCFLSKLFAHGFGSWRASCLRTLFDGLFYHFFLLVVLCNSIGRCSHGLFYLFSTWTLTWRPNTWIEEGFSWIILYYPHYLWLGWLVL